MTAQNKRDVAWVLGIAASGAAVISALGGAFHSISAIESKVAVNRAEFDAWAKHQMAIDKERMQMLDDRFVAIQKDIQRIIEAVNRTNTNVNAALGIMEMPPPPTRK